MATLSSIPTFSHIVPAGGPVAPASPSKWEMIGESAAIRRLRLQVRRIGPHFRTVLVTGEAGSGKEMTARALHRMSAGASGPFVMSAAGNRMDYLMKMAYGGTLFFDSIDEMPLATQDELLIILRKNEWAQEGLAAPMKAKVRIVAATSQDLRVLAAAGRFRQELQHRIAMLQIAAPSLRERADDVPLLATHFLERFTRMYGRRVRTIAGDAMERLRAHGWPGNVRELENAMRDAVLRCEGSVLEARQLPALAEAAEMKQTFCGEATKLQEVIEQHVLRVLNNCGGNKLRAAELLGISRSTLYRMLEACSAGGVEGYTGE